MPWPQRPLDSSLADRIAAPSPTFQEFVRHFFTEPRIWLGREADITLVDRLDGAERATAEEMIAQNVTAGFEHIVDAAAHLKIANIVSTLQQMLAGETEHRARFVLACALSDLGALDEADLFAVTNVALHNGGPANDILWCSYRRFRPELARRLIDVGLRRADYFIRCSALDALIGVSYIEKHGGKFTTQLGQEILDTYLASSTVGSGVPSRYDEMQHFIGETVFLDSDLRAKRLEELEVKYAPPTR
jgi:hypothetical protein